MKKSNPVKKLKNKSEQQKHLKTFGILHVHPLAVKNSFMKKPIHTLRMLLTESYIIWNIQTSHSFSYPNTLNSQFSFKGSGYLGIVIRRALHPVGIYD